MMKQKIKVLNKSYIDSKPLKCYYWFVDFGEVSEWFKVTVSKTVVLNSTVGSNPILSVYIIEGVTYVTASFVLLNII